MDRSVFIVEDNEGVAGLLRELCTELGAGFVTLRGGSEALAQLESLAMASRLPTAVVLDLALAELDGFQVAAGLRQMPGGADIPIVVISGVYKRLPEAFETLVHPVFLPKPFEPAAIRKVLQEALSAADRALGIERGRFAKATPSQLFMQLSQRRASGLLEISTQDTKRRLWWQAGQIRFGQSNVRSETAGAMQVQRGELSQPSFDRAVAHARQAKVPLHEALAATAVLPPDALGAALKLQTQEVALGALSMAGAEWQLTQTDLEKVPDARRHPLAVIIDFARRLMNVEDAGEALARFGDLPLARTPTLERELFLVRTAWPGETLLALVATPQTLGEVLPKVRPEDLPLLWALITSGLLTSESRAVGAWVKAGAAPPDEVRPGASLSATEKQSRAFILAEQARTKDLDSYGILGVAKGASVAECREAFLALARKYHADSYAGQDLGDAREPLSNLFQRLSSAHEMLTDENRRAEYDIFLARKAEGLPTDVATVLRAEELFKRAELLLKSNQKAKASFALELLQEAIALNAADPEFHVYRAYAAFRSKEATPTSAAAARDAIAQVLGRAPNLASAYFFLGLIARDLGADADAIVQLGKALELDPKDEFATRELRAVRHRHSKTEGSLFRRLFKK